MPLAVSIVIPAHNAAATLGATLASVFSQSHQDWEIVIVENGSTDHTADVALGFASRDPRIRAVSNPIKGVSPARNCGIELARHDWLLFLDADDWILPSHLEKLTAILASDPSIDAVHCGWRRVNIEGVTIFEEFGSDDSDLFPLLARTCPFAIHACLVRRSLVREVGSFDPSLRTCEDWDLWQRLARAGARFAALPEILACYRARPNSASMDGRQMFSDGFKVIGRAFTCDPRVPKPTPRYAPGLSPETLPSARLDNLIWQAGLILGAGHDATELLQAVSNDPPVSLVPESTACSLFEALLLPTASPQDSWWRLYRSIALPIERFLTALETHNRQKGVARTILNVLERRAVRAASFPRPDTVGHTHAIAIEITQPFPDLRLPAPIDRLHCRVEIEGEPLGELELPVCDGLVVGEVLADAVAAEFAWPILGRFFSSSIYRTLRVRRDASGWSVLRGEHVLAHALPGKSFSWSGAHDVIGWTLFLQEIWALPQPDSEAFYAADTLSRRKMPANAKDFDAEWLAVDVLDSFSDPRRVPPHVDLVLTIADVPVSRTPAIVPKRTLTAHALRAATTADAGFELCRICVREALLQQPLSPQRTLRERLTEARRRRRQRSSNGNTASPSPTGMRGPAPFAIATAPRPDLTLCPRFPSSPCGSSGSRRALLPRVAVEDVHRLALIQGVDLLTPSPATAVGATILYSPELLLRPRRSRLASSPTAKVAPPEDPRFFDQLFSSRIDPWDYTSDYEQTKYRQTLDLLPSSRIDRALELACAEGHFTEQLAARVDGLLATDVSAIAVQRAQQRCARFGHVRFQQLDLVYDPLPGHDFDLIVCSEVLYFTGSRATLEVVADKLAQSVSPGGHIVLAHGNVHADDPSQPGFDWDLPFGAKTIGEVFAATPGLQLTRELCTPLYRIQLFQRRRPWLRKLLPTTPRRRSIPLPTALPDHVARQVLWHAPTSDDRASPGQTERLPILMYHRIAVDGPPGLSRYRLSPDRFEEQIEYLAGAGYRSVSLEDWRTAREAKRPVAGKRILLTFDDGCVDFATTAWPILQRHGFGAVVFLPSDEIGGRCRWDARFGAAAPIMDWAQIRALRAEGVEFGSHTASHPLLTGLSLEEMAREALRSRTSIEEQLGEPVTSIAYPFGATDRVVESVFGACGYVFGLTCAHRLCEIEDRLLALPRLEVSSDLTLDDFAAMLVD